MRDIGAEGFMGVSERSLLINKIALMAVGVFHALDQASYAASTTSQAIQNVVSGISISTVSDLDFGTASPGDSALIIPPGTSEDSNNASFTVMGAPNAAYTISLPNDGTVVMITGAGATADEQIAVDSFTSFPSQGSNGLLDVSGQESLYIGASRGALSASQTLGTYSATFSVDVVY